MQHKLCFGLLVLCLMTSGVAWIGGPGRSAEASDQAKLLVKPVPFKLAKPDKPLILLETFVNEKGPFRFVLDTGAGATILTPSLARKLELPASQNEKSRQATGAGGKVDISFANVKAIKVGETRREDLTVGVMDLAVISTAIDTEIDGIIGYNFLKHYRVTIDYPKQTVSFE